MKELLLILSGISTELTQKQKTALTIEEVKPIYQKIS